jgi:hypothetical protein
MFGLVVGEGSLSPACEVYLFRFVPAMWRLTRAELLWLLRLGTWSFLWRLLS